MCKNIHRKITSEYIYFYGQKYVDNPVAIVLSVFTRYKLDVCYITICFASFYTCTPPLS